MIETDPDESTHNPILDGNDEDLKQDNFQDFRSSIGFQK